MAAGAGAAAGIVRLHGGTPRQAELAAITLVGTLLGMICDGAKESCGLKVSNAASEAWSAAMLALENRGIRNTQGIISPDIHELGTSGNSAKIFSAADSVMIGLMTRQNKCESRA
ncbi:MAG: L-serine ammonia-lyase, iron-sulfur-dependent, subunit alpha [Bilophila wadsworthia]